VRFATALLLVALAVPAALAQGDPDVTTPRDTLALSARVGARLDATERAYFGLFPNRRVGFIGATFYALPEGGVEVAILHRPTTIERTDTVTLSADEAAALGRYLDTFEDHPLATQNPHYRPNPAVSDPAVFVPYPGRERAVRAAVAGGVYTGQLLYASDAVLVLAPEARPRDRALDGAVVLRRAEVTGVCYDDPTGRGLGAVLPFAAAAAGAGAGLAYGALQEEAPSTPTRLMTSAFLAAVGYSAGRAFRPSEERCVVPGALGTLRARAHYAEARPLEFPDEAALTAMADRDRPDPAAVAPRARRRYRPTWFSVGLTSVRTVGREIEPYTFSMRNLPEPAVTFAERWTALEDAGAPFLADLALRPLRYLRLGVQVRRVEEQTPSERTLSEYVALTPGSVRAYAEAVLPLVQAGDLRLEAAAGVGMERNTRRVSQTFPERYEGPGTASPLLAGPLSYAFEESGSNVFVQGTLEVYTSPRTSFFLQGAWRRPSIEVPLFGVNHRNDPSIRIYTVAPHEVTFGYTEVGLGTRFHF